MESQIDENRALLNQTEVRRVVLDLPLLLLHKVPGPNVDVLEIDECSQEVVKVILTSPVVLLNELVLLIGEVDLLWRYFRASIIALPFLPIFVSQGLTELRTRYLFELSWI